MKDLPVLIMISILGLVGCTDKDQKPETVLTNSQEKALKDAKGVDDTILNADEERRKKLEEDTQ